MESTSSDSESELEEGSNQVSSTESINENSKKKIIINKSKKTEPSMKNEVSLNLGVTDLESKESDVTEMFEIVPWWEQKKPTKINKDDKLPALSEDPELNNLMESSWPLLSSEGHSSFRNRLKNLRHSWSRRNLYYDGCGAGSKELPDQPSARETKSRANARRKKRRERRMTMLKNRQFPSKLEPPTQPDGAPIPEDNMGHRLLERLGWTPGKGLGSDGQGQVEPVACKAQTLHRFRQKPCSSLSLSDSQKVEHPKRTDDKFPPHVKSVFVKGGSTPSVHLEVIGGGSDLKA